MDEVISAVKCPMLIFPTSNDPKISQPGGEVEKVLKEKAKVECILEPCMDQVHGFVNRGDVSDPKVKAGVEKVLARAEEFIKSKVVQA